MRHFFFFSSSTDIPQDKVQGQGKRFTTTSVLRLKPGSDDDYREYTCQAKHKSLQAHMPMSATVQLSVLCESASFDKEQEKELNSSVEKCPIWDEIEFTECAVHTPGNPHNK